MQSARLNTFKWFAVGSTLVGLSMAAGAIDLVQVYQEAQQHDATILAARATAEAERERLPQAKAQLLPSLNAGLSRNTNRLTSVTPNFLGVEQTSYTSYPSSSQNLTLRQPLYRPQLTAQYRQASALVADANATLQQEEQNLAVRVSSAYFEAMLTNDQLALILAQQAAYKIQLDASRKFFQAGAGTRTDVDEAQARLDMNAALEIEARQNVDYTIQQLQTLVSQPIDKIATLDTSEFLLQDLTPNRSEEWMARAELNSPLIQSLKSRVAVAREEVNKASAGHYPTLDATAQWSDSESESVSNTSSRYTNKSLGLQLNIPLFAGGFVNSQVRQALAGQQRAEHQLEAGRRDLQLRVSKEFRNVTESIPKIKALEQAQRSSDQLVLSSRNSFQAGSRTVLDILNAEQQRMVVLRDLAQARYMYLLSKIRLLAVVDGNGFDAIVSANQALRH